MPNKDFHTDLFMKRIFLVTAIILIFSQPLLAQSVGNPLQAELMRSTSGRTLNDQGFASGLMPLKKGMIFDVVEQKMGFVVLSINGAKVVVQQTDVNLSPKAESATPMTSGGVTATESFTPGQIVLISAKYTLEGNQPRNVKNRLSKLVPQGIITAPVRILVSDTLSSAAMQQGNVSTGVISGVNNNTAVLSIKTPARNILTVQYSFNGQVRTAQAAEGDYLILP